MEKMSRSLKQLINMAENTKCPMCGRYTLKYKERIIKEKIYEDRPLIIQPPERYIHCENKECWREFGFILRFENEIITNLELKEL